MVRDVFDTTVTIYNFYDGKYYPTIIENVEFQYTKASSYNGAAINIDDTVVLNIHLEGLDKPYRKPKSWNGDTGSFTIDPNGKKDFFAVGGYGTEIIDDEADEYSSGFYKYMRKKYDDVYLINSVAEFKLIPHIEVGGK